jgi:hypothetical protein
VSLYISNKATAKQLAMLKKLNYCENGKYTLNALSVEQAAALIDELFEEQRLHRDEYEPDYFNQGDN